MKIRIIIVIIIITMTITIITFIIIIRIISFQKLLVPGWVRKLSVLILKNSLI